MKNTRPADEQTSCGCLEKEKVGAEIMKTIGELEEVLKKEGILKGYTGSVPAGKPLTGLSWDSQKAKRGDLFICKGFNINMGNTGVAPGSLFFRPASDFYTFVAESRGGIDYFFKRIGIQNRTDKTEFHKCRHSFHVLFGVVVV